MFSFSALAKSVWLCVHVCQCRSSCFTWFTQTSNKLPATFFFHLIFVSLLALLLDETYHLTCSTHKSWKYENTAEQRRTATNAKKKSEHRTQNKKKYKSTHIWISINTHFEFSQNEILCLRVYFSFRSSYHFGTIFIFSTFFFVISLLAKTRRIKNDIVYIILTQRKRNRTKKKSYEKRWETCKWKNIFVSQVTKC